MASATDIRKGQVLLYQNVPHWVVDMQHRTQGRQSGFVQVTLRNLHTGSSTKTKFGSNDNITLCFTESKDLEYAYADDAGYHFLNPNTFEDEIIPSSLLEDQKLYLISGIVYAVMFVEGKPVQLQLPTALSMKVIEASEGLRGDTASNAQKPIVTESGLTVQVPLFIKRGEVIRVSTSDGSYLGRA
jgi:elongation factor P